MELTESQTRSLLINPQLVATGWKLSDRTQVRFEVPVVGYDPTPWNGITDFCLYQPSARVLSVVEAKRASRNPREGEEQHRRRRRRPPRARQEAQVAGPQTSVCGTTPKRIDQATTD